MQRKRLLFAVTLLAILLSILVMVVPGSHAIARNTISIETPTATPDANQILNQANTVATQADHTAAEAQNTLTVLNFVLALFSVIIGILGLASGALVAYAFRVINRYRKQLDEGQAEMVKMRTAMNNTQKAVVYLGLGDRLYNQDRKQEAVTIYRKAGSLLPGDAEIHNVLGRIYSGTGYYEDAIKSFETTLAADPNFAEAHMEMGLAYRRQGDAQKGPDAETLRKADYDQAITHLKNAVVLRSDYEDALAGLGAVYRRMGDKERDAKDDVKASEYYELAREYYEQAYKVSPSSSYALGNVASLSWYLGGKNAAYDYINLARSAAKL